MRAAFGDNAWGQWGFFAKGLVFGRAQLFGARFASELFELLYLLVEVFVKLYTLYERCIRLLDLIAIETDEDSPDVVDKLINP